VDFILHIFDKSYTFMNYGSIFFSDILLSYTKFSFCAIFVNKRNNKWRMISIFISVKQMHYCAGMKHAVCLRSLTQIP